MSSGFVTEHKHTSTTCPVVTLVVPVMPSGLKTKTMTERQTETRTEGTRSEVSKYFNSITDLLVVTWKSKSSVVLLS